MLMNVIILIILIKCVLSSAEEMVFGQCLKAKRNSSLMTCVGQQALSSLYSIEEQQNFTIDNGLFMIKEDTLSSRSLPSFMEQDPMDFRGILENAGAVIGKRSLQWDLGMLHPGLCMRIGPTADTNSQLEFLIDPNRARDDRYIEEDTSTARIISRQFLVPFLLGLKFNLATIIPLLFAGIILLCKKAALLGKFALFLTGIFGVGSLFSLSQFGGHHGFFGGHRPFFTDVNVATSGGGFGGGPLAQQEHLSGGYYKNGEKHLPYQKSTIPQIEPEPIVDNFYDYEKKVLIQDRKSKLYEKEIDDKSRERQSDGYRNFAWTTTRQ